MNIKFTIEEIEGMISEGGFGFCKICDEEAEYYCDPDTRAALCENCGENGVYGVEELIQMGELLDG